MTLFLHIGMSKTGTTALQNSFFHRNLGLSNVGKPDFSSWPALYEINQAIKKDDTLDLTLARRNAEIGLSAARQSGKPIVWSDENLSNRSDTLARNAERLAAVFPDATILITVREQFEWLQSLYFVYFEKSFVQTNRAPPDIGNWLDQNRAQQKIGQNNYLDRLRYDRLVEIYDDFFGRERVKVMFYERFVAARALFLEDLCGFLGIDPSDLGSAQGANDDARPRRRLSARRATLMAAAKHLPLGAVWQALPDRAKQLIRSNVDSGVPANAALSTPLQQELMEIVGPANRRLSERVGFDVATLGYRT